MKTRSDIKISIADGSDFYCNILSDILVKQGFNIIGKIQNEKDMLLQLATNKPDILIYDFLSFSERFYLTMDKIKKSAPDVKVFVLSFDDSDDLIKLCFKHGVNGFCNKSLTDLDSFSNAIEKMNKGETIILVKEAA